MEIKSGEPGKAKSTPIVEIVSGHLRRKENRWITVWTPISVWLGVMKPDGRHKIKI